MPAITGRPAYRLYQWLWAGIDLLYPPSCGGCGERGSRWCVNCQAQVRRLTGPICPVCGGAWPGGGPCPPCRAGGRAYRAARSWAIYEGSLRNAILRLKYKGDMALGEILARPLVEMVDSLETPIDLITPVPSGLARQAARGYNQAALIARPVALARAIAYQPQALIKVRSNHSQVGLSPQERRRNVAGAFQAVSQRVQGRSVLVVDDIYTTGATVEACAAALRQAGARQVQALTLARAAFETHR